ncbi:MAG: SapC family protein [Pseudomonadota bacterium]
MANPVLLNNVEHKDLKIVTTRSAAYGDNVMFAVTFPAEFRNLQAHYPIVFRKTGDGVGFDAMALLGFQDGENLFLNEQGWDAPVIPLTVARHPFLIGVAGEEMMVNIDLDNPRVSSTEGVPLFLPHGGNTEYMEQATSILLEIHQGLQTMKPFVAALLEHGLLESFSVDIELPDGSQNRLAGFYTIHEENLMALPGDVLERFMKSGYLNAIYMVVASMSNFNALVDRKTRANAAQR